MLRDSAAAAVIVRTRPRAIPLIMITMRKSTHGFPFLSHMSMGLRLAALGAAGAPLKKFTDLYLLKTRNCKFRRTATYCFNTSLKVLAAQSFSFK